MAIVSKTDRHGVDVVIENLQQNLYPRLLAYWDGATVYTSYPRANKNYQNDDSGDVIAVISLDEKDYNKPVMDDKVFVNSFWLVENTRPYDPVQGWLTHNVSIIFQADLVKLYGQTNRADEEFNMDVLRELNRVNPYMFDTEIEVIETVDSVYADLTISGDMKKKLNQTDIGKLHVVRFNFEIRYQINCIPDIAPVCPSSSETFNGAAITSPVAGQTKAITVYSDAAGSPQVGTIIVDTANALDIEVPAGGSVIYDVFLNGIDTGQDLDMDGTNHTININ